MKREIGDYVQDIVEAMSKAIDFAEGVSFDAFLKDEKTIFAEIRGVGDYR